MPKYKVHGQDRQTGTTGAVIVDADSGAAALNIAAQRHGLQVIRFEPVESHPEKQRPESRMATYADLIAHFDGLQKDILSRAPRRGLIGRSALGAMIGSACTTCLVGGVLGVSYGSGAQFAASAISIGVGVVLLLIILASARN